MYGEIINAHTVLVRKPEGKSPLRRTLGLNRKTILKKNLKKVDWEGVNLIHLAQDREDGGLL
jgi:hypothetical protein